MGRKRVNGETNAELRQADLKTIRLGGKPGIMAVRLYEASRKSTSARARWRWISAS